MKTKIIVMNGKAHRVPSEVRATDLMKVMEELDALEPKVINGLIEKHVGEVMDVEKWKESTDKEDEEIKQLKIISDNWEDIADYARDLEE